MELYGHYIEIIGIKICFQAQKSLVEDGENEDENLDPGPRLVGRTSILMGVLIF